MPFTGPFEDRLAIRELYGSYSGAGFAGDRESWLACWADDPVWDTPAGRGEGETALCAIWDGLWSGIETMAFSAEVTAIEVDGDRARSRAYCREVSDWKDGRKVKIIGRYDDELVRTADGRRFARRTFTMHLDEGGLIDPAQGAEYLNCPAHPEPVGACPERLLQAASRRGCRATVECRTVSFDKVRTGGLESDDITLTHSRSF